MEVIGSLQDSEFLDLQRAMALGGLMARPIRRLTSDEKIVGSNPGGVAAFSFNLCCWVRTSIVKFCDWNSG